TRLLSLPFTLLCFSDDTASTATYTLSLHDALPIFPPSGGRLPHEACRSRRAWPKPYRPRKRRQVRKHLPSPRPDGVFVADTVLRSEEHTSELQSRENLVCRLLLEKKKKKKNAIS